MLSYGIALSLHLGLAGDYNAFHPYLRMEENNVISGVYYNSIGNISIYAGYEYDITDEISIEVGGVTGYYKFVIPMVKVNYGDFYIMPAADEDVGVVIGIQF